MLMPSIFGENLFDELFDDFARPAKRNVRYSTPLTNIMKTDVKETEGAYELDIELPGYKKEEVKAELKEGYLTISAEKKAEKEEKDEKDENGTYIRRERYFGACSRSFYVGEDIAQDEIQAKFEDGILKVSVPKKEAKPAVDETKYISIS